MVLTTSHYTNLACYEISNVASRRPNSGQNQNITTANESFENVAKFKYLGTTLTYQNDIHDEIRSRLNSGNAFVFPSHIKIPED
jgi:hypothetical protein